MDAAERALTTWLDSAPNRERTGDFLGMRLNALGAVLARLPKPPAPLTVAGTKGKGSTLALVEAALLAHGERTVAFSSPHVTSVLERWRMDGRSVAPELAWQAGQLVRQAERDLGDHLLTWYERAFALAVVLASSAPDIRFLVEVGLGGRLDCANVLDAAVAVVTHLSHDHREVLGPTLRHIAGEKLPIARPGRPLVIARQSTEADAAIAEALADGVAAGAVIHRPTSTTFTLALAGAHQQDNAATALLTVRLLRGSLDEEKARAAMARVTLEARCQLILHQDRRILVDGAHNGPSVAATLAVARDLLSPGFTVVLGLAQDKELAEILATIPKDVNVHRCAYASPRARRQDQWQDGAISLNGTPWHDDIREALAAIPGDLCVTGSFYLAGEALSALADQAAPKA